MPSTAARSIVLVAGPGSEAAREISGILEGLCDVPTLVATPEDVKSAVLEHMPDVLIIDLDSIDVESLDTLTRTWSEVGSGPLLVIAASADGGRGIEMFSRLGENGAASIEYLPLPTSIGALRFLLGLGNSTS